MVTAQPIQILWVYKMINESKSPAPPLSSVTFDWTPRGTALSYTLGGNTYPYAKQQDNVTRATDTRYATYITQTNTVLTFTATVISPPPIAIVEYRWNFGDGTVGYGPTVNKTYLGASQSAEVSLTVLDTLGRSQSRHQVLNLRPANIITGIGFIVGA